MADISKYLEDILSAIYGEEVRHSIHDAIAAIDNEVYTGVEDAKAEVAKAAAQAANAAASAQSAATSASTASQAATRAGASVTSAANEADRAKTEANKAAGSASSASSSASKAAASATLSQSWATGDTASRAGEESNNSKYYAEQAQRALSAISGSLVPMGTITFEQLPSAPLQPGVMYNISNEFTTDTRFNEGAGHKYGAGTNVYWTGESKWDCLAAPGGIDENAFIPRGNIEGNWRPSLPGAYRFNNSDMQDNDAPKGLTYNYGMLLVFYSSSDTVTYLAIPHINDTRFAFRQKWGSLENLTEWRYVGGSGATISPYVSTPLPPSTTGSPGTAEEYARGDHVHPIGTVSVDNVSGVLPVAKGGTGNSIANPIYEELSTTDFRKQINQPTESAFIMPANHSVGSDNWDLFAPGVKFGVGNVHGYIMVSHTGPNVKIGGGYNSVTQWSKSVAFIDSNIADFSGVLPVEKGGTGSSTGLSNAMLKSSGGIVKEDWNNLFTKKQNAIYTIATWSFEQKNAPPVDPFFGTLFNYYDEGMNYGYQLAVNVGGYLYLREWHDDTIYTPWREIITSKNVATSTTAGLVKPGAGLQVSEDGTLSVSAGASHLWLPCQATFDRSKKSITIYSINNQTGLFMETEVTATQNVPKNITLYSIASSPTNFKWIVEFDYDSNGKISFSILTDRASPILGGETFNISTLLEHMSTLYLSSVIRNGETATSVANTISMPVWGWEKS